ncbi:MULTISPECIES: aldehyde dehydrogenase (NADP(+)) [Prauserella salsuginis group]|uniref:Aldehyde dehydrogenase (NADP(+)) n=1 Tax=Prauserella salsuginis TaxID=387889 RepID=A0ABW6G8L6_9PSEU|nr:MULTISPECIES: aldehyde dehydrogenase (NADP(+)) [Prauserella salsuginis group]MCR3722597.1 NADP-dependent aldehyde dehydrogenase [Prauserella flava]MCR3737039.1 NADP-dependent aldehyde dehydrogenase [Prauserella salsuginis]
MTTTDKDLARELTAPAEPTTAEEVDRIAAASAEAGRLWARTDRAERSRALEAVADALDDAAPVLIPIAGRETHLTEGRLAGELARTTFQLRLFAETVREGSYLDARIDHADPDWPMGAPRPELRRSQVPLGPVVVFAASNFPFAFSVAGGDTASALAAGCPVILKAHPGHPDLSATTGAVVRAALENAGAPVGLFDLVWGAEAGRAALSHPQVKAGAFTGSIEGGRALFDIACSRPEPIPFFGELGSVNPVFVTRAADAARGAEIAAEFTGSFTLGAGQFCTKPGLLLVPSGATVTEVLRDTELSQAAPLLGDRIVAGYHDTLRRLSSESGVEVLRRGSKPEGEAPTPTLLATHVTTLLADPDRLVTECFGPTALVVTYDDETELVDVARAIDGQLTATLIAEETDDVAADLTRVLVDKAGRLLWNQWPTGVSVTYAQQHGGPYPATTAPATTSVGTAAIDRFVRAVAFQNYPQHLLPDELTDSPAAPVLRRVDGVAQN